MDSAYLLLNCSCSQLDHVVRFSFFPEQPDEYGDFQAHIEVVLNYEKSLWRRLKVAWRYLWQTVCGYEDVSEVLIADNDLHKLRAWLERAEHEANIRKMRYENGGQSCAG